MTNEELDKAILETLVAKSPQKLAAVCLWMDVAGCVRRRLQSLRKRGFVEYDSKAGWSAK